MKARHFSEAYYMLGYAAECALKACIAKQTRRGAFPARQTGDNNPYTHDLQKLRRIAGLNPAYEARAKTDPSFERNWAVVRDWSEETRYETKSEQEARDLFQALASATTGVMAWVRLHW